MSDKPSIVRAWGDYCIAREAGRGQTTRQTVQYLFDVYSRTIDVDQPIDSVTVEDFNRFIRTLIRQGKITTTIRQYIYGLKAFYDWCVRQGLIVESPVQKTKMPALPAFVKPRRAAFSMEQLQRLDAQIKREEGRILNTEESHDWAAAIQIGYWTGMRFSDVATLEWVAPEKRLGSWVDMVEQIIIVHPMKKRARRERLEIPIQSELYDLFQRLMATRSPERTHVLPMMAFNYVNARAMMAMQFSRLCKRCGLAGYSFHSFRHGFVSRLVNGGIDPIIIGSMTGQSVAQIKAYAHVNRAARRDALESVRESVNEQQMETA